MSEHVAVTIDGGVCTLRLRRPSHKNALTGEMYSALSAGLAAASRSSEVRVVVLTGSDGTFTAGNDLTDFLERPDTSDDAPAVRFLRALATFDKPLIAAVQGHAIGIGTTLLLHCDLVYAAERTRFLLPFVPLGLVPEAASSLLLPERVGALRAAELLLLAEPFDAARAAELGLVSSVHTAEELPGVVAAAAAKIAAHPVESVQLTKRLLRAGRTEPVLDRMREELDLLAERLAAPETRTILQSFFDRGRR